MREENLISIVLPVYNGERYLRSSLDSILAQTYTRWELIIVNDGSTDGTAAIAAEYAGRDGRIRAFDNPMNMKLPKSLNAGFMRAAGDYYIWASDDDLLRPDALEILAAALDGAPDVGMVYCDYSEIDENGNLLRNVSVPPPDRLPYGNGIGPCRMYRRTVAEAVGDYDPNAFLAEDYDYWLRIYGISNIQRVQQELYRYRRHGGSLTGSSALEAILRQTGYVLKKNFLMLCAKIPDRRGRWQLYDNIITFEPPETKALVRRTLERDAAYRLRNRVKAPLRTAKHAFARAFPPKV